jgi:RNA polymerase sigma-B factor
MPQAPTAPSEAAAGPSRSRRAREDAHLFERYRRTGDKDAREALVTRHLPLARHLARQYASKENDDLVQVASIGLMKAIDRFDHTRGIAFSSFAVPTIVGELKRYFRDHAWTVRVPRELHDRALHVQRASERLSKQFGRSPMPADIADALDTSVGDVLDALQTVSALHPARLDAPAEPDDDVRGGPTAAFEETGYETAEASATLAPLLARLTPQEQQIVRLRFEHDLTQSEIGARVGFSQMHVSRILRRAIAALSHHAATPSIPADTSARPRRASAA